MADQVTLVTEGSTGWGPRVDFGTTQTPNEYMEFGSYDNINNLDTKGRPLRIFGTPNAPIQVFLAYLPDARTAPKGADLENVVIDKATGQLYIQ